MRRVATILAIMALTGGTALATAGPASAAQGVLWVTGQRFDNPSGCYNATRYPLTATNETDQRAWVLEGPDCKGEIITILPPDYRQHTFYEGMSVRIL